jgi:hypothetical protein
MMEGWIGELSVERPSESLHKRVFAATELSDYLYWAIHREVDPVEQT